MIEATEVDKEIATNKIETVASDSTGSALDFAIAETINKEMAKVSSELIKKEEKAAEKFREFMQNLMKMYN